MGKKVLLYGTMGDIGATARDNLLGHGLEVHLADFPQNVFRDEFGYRRGLGKILAALQPDVLIPVGCPVAMARFKRDEGERYPGLKICVESEDKVRLLDSKVRFYEFAQSLGLPQPQSFPSPESVPEGVPTVFKRDVSFGGHGVHLPRTIEATRQLINHQSPGEPYLIEELIEGTDYSIDAVRIGYRTVFSSYRCEKAAGRCLPSSRREIVHFPQLEEIASAVLDALDYKGVCGFDFIVSPDSQPWLLEANPRFTGGLGTQIEAGFEIPWLLCQNSGIF